MTNWTEFTGVAPELAAKVRARFETTGLGYLATLRKDGSPRVSGVEPLFALDEVWLGMMPDSLKGIDLRRDPRCTLHAANVDKNLADGDARVSGRAVEVTDDATIDRMRKAFGEATGQEPPPGPMWLFRLDLTEAMFLVPNVDHLLIETWHPASGYRSIQRY